MTGKSEEKDDIIIYIRKRLFEMQDTKYRDFHSALMPGVDKNRIIGVRMPQLRAFAKEIRKLPELARFLNDLPHRYYEEDNLHGILISYIREYSDCVKELERFLPYVNNWATCDMMSPPALKKDMKALAIKAKELMDSDHLYTVRFGIGIFMKYFLDDAFSEEYPQLVAEINSDEYYVNMMRAWYFATALAKQYEKIIPYIEEKKLDVWTHNKTIQKAVESRRISEERKLLLKTMKIKKKQC